VHDATVNGPRWLAFVAVALALGSCSASAPKTGAPAVSAPAARDPDPPAFRLPGEVRPTRYRLELTIDPSTKQASGSIAIDVSVGRPAPAIWLHADPAVAITSARVGGAGVRTVRKGDLLGLVGDHRAGPTTIELAFTAPIDHARSRGIYAENEAGVAYAYTFFEAIDARRAFPCFDEPGFKTPWTLVLRVKKDHVALANTAIASEAAEGDWKRVEFVESKPLPTYLVAFIVGPFEVIDGGVGGRAKTKIQFAVPKGRSGELAWARDVTPRVVTALEDYFDMAYPWGKLDVAVVPRYWGTMEHPGIVAMGQPLTLIRPEQMTRARKQRYANILAHELAHYWFGDYVTMRWWDDAWLNESLGQWMDLIITNAVEPSWRVMDSRPESSQFAMTMDEALATKPIRRPVRTREQIEESFDSSIVYAKGASVTRMLEAWLGPDKWRDFIRAYMAKHAWGNASAEDLFAMLRDKLGQPAEQVMRSFIEQPGVPVISFELACDVGAVKLRQTRSLPLGHTDPAKPLWHVPVCFRYGTSTASHETCTVVASAEVSVPITGCPSWLVPNRDARGYYRSALDTKLVQPLFDTRSPLYGQAKPTPVEKMMTVADLRSAVNRGELPIDQLLALAPRVVHDSDPLVARTAVIATSFPADALDDNLYQLARGWLDRLYGPSARRLRWQRLSGDSDEKHQLRIQLLPRVARHDSRLGLEAERLADRWLKERKGLPDDLVDAALAVAAYRGKAPLFDRYLDAAKVAKDRTEQARLLGALGGFIDPVLAKRALELVLGTQFDLRDTRGIFFRMIYQRETRDLALDFVEKHIGALLPRMRDDEASWFMTAIASAFCDPERRKRAADLVLPRASKIGGAEAAVRRGLEKSDQCIAELARQLPDLQAFLKK
jgi:aminopeptidase N